MIRSESGSVRAFRRKVELLEQWVHAGGVPNGEEAPQTVAELKRWVDPDRGLTSWKDPHVTTSTGQNSELRMRFDAAVTALSELAGLTPNETLQAEKTRLLIENAALIRQNLRLHAECKDIKSKLILAEQKLTQTAKREAEVLRQLKVVRPLKEVVQR